MSSLVAASLCVPLVMFTFMAYDINPAFALAPLVAWAFAAMVPHRLTLAFALAAIGGAISIAVAQYIDPEDPVRSGLGLVLMLTAPSFVFLGRWLVQRGTSLEQLFYWIAVFSAVFLIPVTVRLFLTGEPVRGALGAEGFSFLNARWFGLPVFGTFGVISLAYLICMQAMILAGALFGNYSFALKVLFTLSLACAIFFILGSDSRGAQLCMLWLGAAAVVAVWRFRGRAGGRYVVAAVVIAAAMTYPRLPAHEMRIVHSVKVLSGMFASDPPPGPEATASGSQPAAPSRSGTAPASGTRSGSVTSQSPGSTVPTTSPTSAHLTEDLSTGRSLLIAEGVRETIRSPLIGNGFASYGRYDDEKPTARAFTDNSSTHLYYLTIFWKGGILFAVPLLVFLALSFLDGLRNLRRDTPQGFFVASALGMAFIAMPLTWDILYVPSAGALAWFLLGAAGARSGEPRSAPLHQPSVMAMR